MLVVVQNLVVRRIIPTSKNIMERTKENAIWTIKLICKCRMLLIKKFKNHWQWDGSTSIIILSVTVSSSVSRYQLIDMSILADVFMVLSCPGYRGIQCHKLFDINEKQKGLARHLQLSCTVCLYSPTFFT